MSSRRQRGSQIPAKHWIGLAVLFALTLGVGVMTVMMALDRTEPSTWGTFTEERCVAERRGCQSVGWWVSDDRSLRMDDVVLDGAPGPDGTVPAFFRPTDTFNQNEPWVVRTQAAENANLWFPASMLILLVGCTWWLAARTLRRR